jgi:D-3-phosphoglycerate dehydrogenase
MALGFMIALARHIPEAVIDYRAGREPQACMGLQLEGAVLGIIGFGAIGARLAALGAALGMQVLASDPHKTIDAPGVRQVAQDALLRDADFVVCLAVATEATENLMDAAAFARMKPGARFINLSRGNLVDEAALARALDARHLAGAALDVGRAPDQKPSPFLAGRSDVIATPHTGGLTPQAIEHQAFDTVRQVAELVAGRIPPGAVNAAAAARLARLRAAS